MNQKLIYFIGGLLVGGLGVFAFTTSYQDEALTPLETDLSKNNYIPEPYKGDTILTDYKELKDEVAELKARLSNFEYEEKRELDRAQEEKVKMIEFRLKEYEALFDLSDQQRELIGDVVWDNDQYWASVRAGKVDSSKVPFPKLGDEIRKLLDTDQLELYEEHLDSRKSSVAEIASTAFLNTIPVTLSLSEEQKDQIYGNLYLTFHSDTQSEFNERWKALERHDYDRNGQKLIWASEEVLTEEQLTILKKTLAK